MGERIEHILAFSHAIDERTKVLKRDASHAVLAKKASLDAQSDRNPDCALAGIL